MTIDHKIPQPPRSMPPADIVEAAEKVRHYFASINVTGWQLGGIMDRFNANAQPVGYINPDVLAKLKRGTLSAAPLRAAPFKTEYTGMAVEAVPVYDALSPAVAVPASISADDLAAEIRRVDGDHSLGAAALAEALMPFLSKSVKAIDAQGAEGQSMFPERDMSKPAEQQGLFRKFEVNRVDGSDALGGKHHGCEYFVLDVTHDVHAPAALRAYAESCKSTHPKLSVDLIDRHGAASPLPAATLGKADNLHDRALDVFVALQADKSIELTCMDGTPNFVAVIEYALAQQPAASDVHDGDWPEDSAHENGNYLCRCSFCERTFIGHKRRVICKKCQSTPSVQAGEGGVS